MTTRACRIDRGAERKAAFLENYRQIGVVGSSSRTGFLEEYAVRPATKASYVQLMHDFRSFTEALGHPADDGELDSRLADYGDYL